MDWFLYDIGLLHERVKGITLCDYDFIFLRYFAIITTFISANLTRS